jgi:hypothetical protein
MLFSAAALLCGARSAAACGDKFVVLGQGVRFDQAMIPTHIGSVLLYTRPGSRLGKAEDEMHLSDFLAKFGHSVMAVDTPEALASALDARGFDVILTDAQDAAELRQKIAERKERPEVVPVLVQPTRAELKTAHQQYGCVAGASRVNRDLVVIVNEVIAARATGKVPPCRIEPAHATS